MGWQCGASHSCPRCMNNDSYPTYVEKVQLLLLRVYWLLLLLLMMQMLTSVPAAIAAADAS